VNTGAPDRLMLIRRTWTSLHREIVTMGSSEAMRDRP